MRFYVTFKTTGGPSSTYVEARSESEAGQIFSQQYPNVRSDDVLSVSAVGNEISGLILSRHLVAVGIIVFISTLLTQASEFQSAANGLGYLIGVLLAISLFSFLICGLAALFFTNSQRGHFRRNFVRCVWVFAGLLILGSWAR